MFKRFMVAAMERSSGNSVKQELHLKSQISALSIKCISTRSIGSQIRRKHCKKFLMTTSKQIQSLSQSPRKSNQRHKRHGQNKSKTMKISPRKHSHQADRSRIKNQTKRLKRSRNLQKSNNLTQKMNWPSWTEWSKKIASVVIRHAKKRSNERTTASAGSARRLFVRIMCSPTITRVST